MMPAPGRPSLGPPSHVGQRRPGQAGSSSLGGTGAGAQTLLSRYEGSLGKLLLCVDASCHGTL